MRCFKCGSENPDGAKFCDGCAAPLALRCPSCGTSNRAGAKFCIECAAALGAVPVAASSSGAAQPARPEKDSIALGAPTESHDVPEGERKTVTALFADIKGSTELMRDLDPEEARAIVDPVLQLMMEAVHRYGGYVAQSTGDGIFALFGAPVAHEDHPQRALHAALAMQEELRRYADRLRAEGKIPVEARVGVNTGEVVVRTIETGGHTEYTPVGHVTNLAARMQTAAPAGSIAVSEATQRLCEGYFEFRGAGADGGQRDSSEPVEVYEVVRAGPLRTHFQLAARRGLTRFVGREREMAAMAGALEQARAGHGQIVAAVGEAGAGKSRLYVRVQGDYPGRMQSAGGVLGLARQGVGLAAGDRAAARAISRSPTRTTTVARSREGRGQSACVSTRRSRRRCPTCLSLLGIARRGCVLAHDGRADQDAGARWRRSSASSCARASSNR